MKKLCYLIGIILLFCIGIVSASQTSTYATTTNASNFSFVNNSQYRKLTFPLDYDVIFGSLLNITPITAFNSSINETITGQAVGGINYLTYRDIINTTLKIYNGSNLVQLGNYTISNLTAARPTTYAITWVNGSYNGLTLYVTYNRTYWPGIDDIAGASAYDICGTGCALARTNASADYEKSIGWQVVPVHLNNTNWQVTYSYITRTRTDTTATAQCTNVVSGFGSAIGLAIIAGFVLAAVLIMSVLGGATNIDIKSTILMVLFIGLLGVIGIVIASNICSFT